MAPRFPDLEGKHVLITGGSNGIGAALAVAFAGQGCRVTLLDKDVAAGERVLNACRARSGSGASLYPAGRTVSSAACTRPDSR